MKIFAFVPVLLAATACLAAAQQTWIVDAANGPGTHFTDVPPALQAASDGDTILVRTGIYSNAVTSRGVTMLGEGQPTLVAGLSGGWLDYRALLLNGLPSGRTFVMRGFRLSTGSRGIGAEIRSCAGHVVLADLDVSASFGAQGLQVSNSRDVTVVRSSFAGVARLDGSVVALRECLCRGTDAMAWPNGSIIYYSDAGLAAIQCDLSICGGSFTGGGGILPGSPDQPGLAFEQCTTRIAVGARITIAPGRRTSAQVSAIVANSGTLDLDPSITASLSGSALVTRRMPPVLHASPAALGTLLALTLYAPPLDDYQLFASALADPRALPALGTLWLDAGTYVFLGAGKVTAQGSALQSFFVPSDPLLRGAALRVQALHGGSAGIGLSDPSVVVVY